MARERARTDAAHASAANSASCPPESCQCSCQCSSGQCRARASAAEPMQPPTEPHRVRRRGPAGDLGGEAPLFGGCGAAAHPA
eukprot:2640096-Prymnesium_polylepis.1